MVSLMQRRRALMQSGSSLPAWDAEWSFEDGYPDDTGYGWVQHLKSTPTYTSTATLTTNGLKLWCRRQTNQSVPYIYYDNTQDYNNAIGVMETKMRVKRRASNANGYAEVCFGNGTNGIKLLFMCKSNNKGKLVLPDDADAYSGTAGTVLASFSSDTFYTIKLVLNNGIGEIYRNGTLLIDNVDVSTLYSSADTRFGVNGFSDSASYHYGEWAYVKLKLGRI